MKTISTFIFTGLAFFAMSLSNAFAAEYKTLHIAVDVSGSNPIVTSKAYSAIIAKRIAQQIMELGIGDSVSFRTFGHLDLDNLQQYDVRLTRRARPVAVAKRIAQFIISIPDGRIAPQGSTEIIAHLEWSEYNCAAGDMIILATDGIETGSQVPNPDKLLSGKIGLPKPMTEGYLSGCTVTILGIGKTATGSWPSVNVKYLIGAWQQYLKTSGAQFKILPNP